MSVQKVCRAVNPYKYRAILCNLLHFRVTAVKLFSADGVVSARVAVPQTLRLLITEEYESRDIFCCPRPISCWTKYHELFYNICQSVFI